MSAPHAPAAAGTAPVPDSYFTESRKGEINELRTLLRGFATERDPQRKRDIIKKVIAYMTLGIDVSRLFTEMMLAIETRDLVIKKMVYLYLTNYARTHPELAQMCTNTLQKDCGNEDPMVRGLALRALCGLQLPQMVEYIGDPLRKALSDGHAYVRKTGVMGVLKMYHLDPDGFENSGLVDTLYDMLRDPDASVVANCIIVLNEVMQHSPQGGMALNRAIMLHLLNRIHEFNEFAKVQILELVPRYIPANEEEGFQIMNLLDPVLRTASPGAVLATVRAFLSLAEHVGEDTNIMRRQILERIKAPIVTQISSASSELMYTLLKHVLSLTDLCPGVLDDEYRQFYVRYNEPTHVKNVKLQILPRLANSDTAPDIVSELVELVSDPNASLARQALKSLAYVACHGRGGPGAAEAIARRLVDLLDWNIDHVSSEAAAALTLMLRKHSSLQTLVAPPLSRCLRFVHDPAGKASLVFLIAECGTLVEDAPYALERLIDHYDDIEEPNVKVALLTSTVRLFFQRPPEVQHMLGRLLAKATADVSSQDLHDRALWYYRLLQQAPTSELNNLIQTSMTLPETVPFAEENDQELKSELEKEFNTLAIIYGKPSAQFIAAEHQVTYTKMPTEHPLAPGDTGSTAAGAPGMHTPTDFMGGGPTGDYITETAHQHDMPSQVNALADEVDLLGFGGPSPTASAAPVPSASSSSIQLDANASLSGDDYQNMWGAISDADAIVSTVPLNSLPSSTDIVENALSRVHINTMASGELEHEFKFFLYARDAISNAVLLIQTNVDKTNSSDQFMIVTIKVHGSGDATKLSDQITQIMTKALM